MQRRLLGELVVLAALVAAAALIAALASALGVPVSPGLLVVAVGAALIGRVVGLLLARSLQSAGPLHERREGEP